MSGTDLGFIEEGLAIRGRVERRRVLTALAVSGTVTAIWLVYVTSAGQWPRVVENWESALTMVFGSFVGGSTPQGGGAVAFPVFTKLLSVPSEVARTFSLSIQTVGMGTASLAILLTRRRIAWKAIAVCLPGTLAGFGVALLLLSDRSRPFWPSLIPGPYVKVTFTLILGSMALITFLGSRVPVRLVTSEMPRVNRRIAIAGIVISFIGGVASGLTGSGADVFLYLFLVALLAVEPRIGIPTSVVLMATISALGLIFMGIIDGQLATTLGADGSTVIEIGGRAVGIAESGLVYGAGTPADAARFDLFGLWIAAAPIVAWGAPLGSAVAARVSSRGLVGFVGALALAEIISTVVFLDELHSDKALIIYAVVGAAIFGFGLYWLSRNRSRLLGLPQIDPGSSVSRHDLDLRSDYRNAIANDDSNNPKDER